MSGRNKASKAKIHISKPDLPPFLQRMKEQIVANEDAERQEQSRAKRKVRPGRPDDPDDDPTVVKIGDEDLTEEEYKKMKTELETQYKLDSERTKSKPVELDVDDLIQNRRRTTDDLKAHEAISRTAKSEPKRSRKCDSSGPSTKSTSKEVKIDKKLSYGSTSEDED